MNKPAKPQKDCSNCQYWSQHLCKDSNGNPIEKYDASNNVYVVQSQKYWQYEECQKNWGLPQTAYTSAANCKFYRLKETK